MQKILNFTQNVLGVFALAGIIAVSTFVTIGLSPIAVDESVIAGTNTEGRYAGASTADYPEILSNFIPLSIIDELVPNPRYTSQLVKEDDNTYLYNVRIASQDKGEFSKQMIKVTNPNSAPVILQLSSNVPAEVESSMHIAIVGEETYRIHDASHPGTRVVQYELGAEEEMVLAVNYEYLQNILFPIDIGYTISY